MRKKIKHKITREKSLESMTKFLIIVSIIMVGIISITLPDSQLEGMLREFSQIVSVISIGIGTIAITLSGDRSFKDSATKEVLLTLLIALLAYLLSYLNNASIQRLYLVLSGAYLFYLFGVVTVNIYSTTQRADTIPNKAITSKTKKKKKRKKK